MPDYEKPPELYDGLRLHQNENTGGCSPRVLEALATLRPEQIGVLSAVRARRSRPARATSASIRRSWLALTNGLDEGIMAVAVALPAPSTDGPVPEAIVPRAGVRDLRVRHGGRRRTRRCASRRGRTSPSRSTRCSAAITPRTRVVFLTNPNNPTGVSHAARGDSDDRAAACRRAAIVFVDEAYAEFSGDDASSRARRGSQRDRRPDVLEGVRPGRAAHRLPGRRARRRSTRFVRRSPVYSVNIAAVVADATRRSRIRVHPTDYLRQVAESKALALRGLRPARPDSTGGATRTSCWSAPATGRDARRRRGRCAGASTCATGRPSRAAPAASASPPASSSTRAAAIAVMEEVLCAAR